MRVRFQNRLLKMRVKGECEVSESAAQGVGAGEVPESAAQDAGEGEGESEIPESAFLFYFYNYFISIF